MMRRFVSFLFILAFAACKDEQPVRESCFDKIQNQNEAGVDCGGICPFKCQPVMKATVNGTTWEADTTTASYNTGSQIFNLRGIRKSSFYPSVQLVYTGPLAVGEYALDPSSGYVSDISSFVVLNSGTIRLTSFNPLQKIVEGTFSFTCTDSSTGTVYTVTNGEFRLVSY
ncbi:MAG: hypothetical protein JNL47_08380 [Bacteroidia bacterium]|nr:hypothetical protein [Bacteroidia bacterium]